MVRVVVLLPLGDSELSESCLPAWEKLTAWGHRVGITCWPRQRGGIRGYVVPSCGRKRGSVPSAWDGTDSFMEMMFHLESRARTRPGRHSPQARNLRG